MIAFIAIIGLRRAITDSPVRLHSIVMLTRRDHRCRGTTTETTGTQFILRLLISFYRLIGPKGLRPAPIWTKAIIIIIILIKWIDYYYRYQQLPRGWAVFFPQATSFEQSFSNVKIIFPEWTGPWAIFSSLIETRFCLLLHSAIGMGIKSFEKTNLISYGSRE